MFPSRANLGSDGIFIFVTLDMQQYFFSLKRFGAIRFENLCEAVRYSSMRFDTLIFVRFREAEYQGEY